MTAQVDLIILLPEIDAHDGYVNRFIERRILSKHTLSVRITPVVIRALRSQYNVTCNCHLPFAMLANAMRSIALAVRLVN